MIHEVMSLDGAVMQRVFRTSPRGDYITAKNNQMLGGSRNHTRYAAIRKRGLGKYRVHQAMVLFVMADCQQSAILVMGV